MEWMNEKGVAGELTDDKYRDERVPRPGVPRRHRYPRRHPRLIAASNGEEAFHRAQSHRHELGHDPRA